MKRILLTVLCLAMPLATLSLLTGCGGDEEIIIPAEKPVDNGTTVQVNLNKNSIGPTEAQLRLEFPQLRGGASEVIVHTAVLNSNTGETGVNYSVEWDHQLRATRWVCYEVYNTVRATSWNRNNWANGDPWAYDPDVPADEQQATYSELSLSNPPLPHSTYYQKGHIIASADRLCSKEANEQTFYMTNIYPMVGDFNGGIWSSMESRVRTWGSQADTLYVCKGGTIDKSTQILDYTNETASVNGEETPHPGNHIVPKYFYMAVLSKKGSTLKAVAFWIEHQDGTEWKALKDYAVSIDQLEELTGLDFFCNLPDDTEEQVESSLTLTDWNLK